MKNICRRFLSAVLTLALVLTLIPAVSTSAEEPSGQEYALSITNDCVGAVTYEVQIGNETQELTLLAGETKEFPAPSGTSYTVTWIAGAEKKYTYTAPEQTVYTGTIGQTTETYYTYRDGTEYTGAVSDVVSYGDYSVQTELYAVDTLVTFTRSKSGIFYRYTNVNNPSEYYSATSASGARANIKEAYPESEGWSMATANEDDDGRTECWVFKPVTENQRVVEGNSSLTIHTDADLVVKPEVTGNFTVATLNVDGMPQTINFGGIYQYELNMDGPGSEGSTKIGQYLQNSGYDLIATSENFNYNQQIMAEAVDYTSGTIRTSIPENVSAEDFGQLITNRLFPIDTDGLSLISKKTIPVSGETWVPWETIYSTNENIAWIEIPSGNGADGMIKKGYRFYQVEIAEGVTIDVYILHADADSQEGDIAARTKQFQQLATAINANTNGNPIIVMGDTNCRYTRDTLKTDFIDATGMTDAWVELIRKEEGYPEYGTPPLVAVDKVGEGETGVPYPDCEVVDKIFYLNNPDSPVQLKALEYNIDTVNYVDEEGALGDHWPVSVKFQYTIKGDECPGHEYKLVETVNPSFEADGKEVYECEICGDRYETVIPKLTASSQPDEFMAVKGEEASLAVLDNDQVCTDPLVAGKEIILTDAEGSQTENAAITVQDEKLVLTPDTTGQQSIYYAVRYTLQDGTQYTTAPAEVKLWVYSMTDKTYILSDGGEQVYSDFLSGDVLSVEGMDSEYSLSIAEQSGTYGEAVLENGELKYTPEKYADGAESITVQADVTGENGNLTADLQKDVHIVPDTVVYYDDAFGSNADDTAEENKAGYGIYFGDNWTTETGEDAVNDHSQTVTHASGGAATAEFTFTGTGLDIMSRVSGTQTTLTVQVWKASEDENYTNDNRLQIKLADITYDQDKTLYQVPVIHFDFDTRDTYFVRVMLTPNFTNASDLSFGTLYLDGIRIYGALSQEDAEKYYSEEKIDTTVQDVRTLLESGQISFVNAEQINNVVAANSLSGSDENGNQYTDSNALENYIEYGPNNEVFLQNNNGLAFYVSLNEGTEVTDAKLQIQARMPEGNQKTGKVNYASSEDEAVSFDVKGTTAALYTIDLDKCVKKEDGSYLVVLNTTGEDIVSIENVQYRGLTIHTGLNAENTLSASEMGPYIRMMSGVEEKAVLNVTVKSLFGRTLGTVTLESENAGVPGDTYVFSGRDVYKAVKKEGYYILNLLVNFKNYKVEYGDTKEITVR